MTRPFQLQNEENYWLKTSNSVDYLQKNDFLHDSVDGKLVLNMRSAYKHHSQQLAQEKASKEAMIVELNLLKLSNDKETSKRKAKEAAELATKKAKMAHQRAQRTKLAELLSVNNSQNQTYVLEQYDMSDLNNETGTVWKNPKYVYMYLNCDEPNGG